MNERLQISSKEKKFLKNKIPFFFLNSYYITLILFQINIRLSILYIIYISLYMKNFNRTLFTF